MSENEEIKEAKDELFRLSANDKEIMKYEDRRTALLDKISALEKGKIEVARKSLEAGLDINTISSITGLEKSEIENLIK